MTALRARLDPESNPDLLNPDPPAFTARRAYAFDIDPQALLATRENAIDNAVADRLQLCERAADIPRGCDVLLANILAEVLISLNQEFAALLPQGGRSLLAGILAVLGLTPIHDSAGGHVADQRRRSARASRRSAWRLSLNARRGRRRWIHLARDRRSRPGRAD